MSSTVFDQFAHRITDVTAQLTDRGILLTAPAPAPAADPTDAWASSRPLPLDRSTLAWCTAAQMLADHHHTGIDRQVLSADALLRELGVRGLAQLHSDLRNGAPVDYRFTRCPYCSGIGEDPTQPTCEEVSCPPGAEFAGHDHLCPVCHGAEHDPQWSAEQQMQALEKLLAYAVEDERPTRSPLLPFLRQLTTSPPIPEPTNARPDEGRRAVCGAREARPAPTGTSHASVVLNVSGPRHPRSETLLLQHHRWNVTFCADERGPWPHSAISAITMPKSAPHPLPSPVSRRPSVMRQDAIGTASDDKA